MDPQSSLQLFRGVSQGGWDPTEHNFHLYTIVIGAQALHATGYAMGVRMDGNVGTGDPDRDTAVICYFGDGASSQGDVNEAFVYAASFDAPSSSSARTTSGPSPSRSRSRPASRSSSAPAASASPACASTATTSSPPMP